MKPSTFLLCLAPTIALAVETEQNPPAVAPTPSLPNNTPPVPLPAIPTRPQGDAETIPLDAHQMLQLQEPASIQAKSPLSLRALKSTTDLSKSLGARSEGTLGQTPWIGMAIGLTFTALAAVMLG